MYPKVGDVVRWLYPGSRGAGALWKFVSQDSNAGTFTLLCIKSSLARHPYLKEGDVIVRREFSFHFPAWELVDPFEVWVDEARREAGVEGIL